jgi:hypothetical protein
VETVAAGDEVASDFVNRAFFLDAYRRARTFDGVERDVSALKAQIAAVGKATGDKILDDLLLAIDSDALARELDERNAMTHTVEPQFDAFVAQPFSLEPLSDTGLPQHINAGVFQYAGAYPFFTIGARACFEKDGTDPMQMQQL